VSLLGRLAPRRLRLPLRPPRLPGRDPVEQAVSALREQGATIRVDTGSGEAAEELLDVLGKHGLTCRQRRVGSSDVEISCLDGTEPRRTLETATVAVELWLLLDPARREALLRVGRAELPVAKPATSEPPAAGTGGFPAPATPAG